MSTPWWKEEVRQAALVGWASLGCAYRLYLSSLLSTGAAGLAAVLPGGPLDLPEYKNKNVAVLLCGSNIDIAMLGR